MLWTKLSLMVVMLLSAVSFTACVDDNEDVGMPFLELDIEELPLTEEGGTATFTVSTNRPWTATLGEGSEWISLSTMEGAGTEEVEISVPATTYGRVGEVQFHLSNTYAVYETKTLVVKQGEVEEEEIIYSETVGTQSVSSPYPYVDAYTSWQTDGTGASTVTYTGKSASVRASGLANAGSGPNVIFFGTLPAYFQVNTITLQPQHQRLALSFLGSFSYKPEGSSEYDNTFNFDNFTVEISGDGKKWSKLECTKDNGDAEHPYWISAESKFVLKEVPEQLSIRFTAAFASAFRLDDISLTTFNGTATEIDLAQGKEEGGSTGGETPVVPAGDKIFYESFGTPVKEGTYWPYANENATNIMTGTGVVAGTTTYKGYGVTARTVGTYTSPNPPASGEGHIWFPAGKTADKNFFEVQKLNLNGEKNLDISFYLHGNTDPYTEGDVVLQLSADGEKWTTVAFTTAAIAEAAESTWKVAKASVTLKESPANFYLKFSSETTGGCRLDDPTIVKGNGGTEIDLGAGTSGEEPTPPTPSTDVSTDFPGAGKYLMVATADGKALAATPLTADKNYGYLSGTEVTVSNGQIAADGTSNGLAWTVAAASSEGQYTLYGADSRYYYMTGTYNSFNVNGSAGTDGYAWVFTKNTDGTYAVKNVTMQKTLQYDTNYSSYGAYPDTRGLMTDLYKLNAEGTAYVKVTGAGTGGEEPTPPAPSGGEYDGEYLVVANVEGAWKAATPVPTDKTYGYLQPTDVTVANNAISADAAAKALAFTLKQGSTTGQYSLYGADGRYYYLSGTHNSTNVTAELGTDGYYWTVAKNSDNTFTLTNVTMSKTLQYDTQYGSYGVYPDVRGLYVYLFKLNAAGTAYEAVSELPSTGGSTEPDQPDQPDTPDTPDQPATGSLLWNDDFSQFDSATADGTADIGTSLTGSLDGFKDSYTGEKVYSAAGKIKLGSSSKKGKLTTPAMKATATVGATLTVDLAAWANASTGATDSAKVVITVNGGTIEGGASVTVTLDGTMKSYTYTLSGVSSATTITFEAATASKCRFYLDNLKVQQQ